VRYPVNRRLEPYLGARVAPLVVITGAVVVVFAPVAYITVVLFRELKGTLVVFVATVEAFDDEYSDGPAVSDPRSERVGHGEAAAGESEDRSEASGSTVASDSGTDGDSETA